jgi:predicted DsbA family dithiol-disulfide isomerase
MVTECERELARRLADTKAEIERLRAERDAMLRLCVTENPGGRKFYAAFEGHGVFDEKPKIRGYRSYSEVVAAVRRAAGIDPEAAP